MFSYHSKLMYRSYNPISHSLLHIFEQMRTSLNFYVLEPDVKTTMYKRKSYISLTKLIVAITHAN